MSRPLSSMNPGIDISKESELAPPRRVLLRYNVYIYFHVLCVIGTNVITSPNSPSPYARYFIPRNAERTQISRQGVDKRSLCHHMQNISSYKLIHYSSRYSYRPSYCAIYFYSYVWPENTTIFQFSRLHNRAALSRQGGRLSIFWLVTDFHTHDWGKAPDNSLTA